MNNVAPKKPKDTPSNFMIAHFAFCLGELHGCLFQLRQDTDAIAYFAERGKSIDDLDELGNLLNDLAGCFYK